MEPYGIVLAPNPSIMTGTGTNTVLVGHGGDGAMVVDPAVDDPEYVERLIQEGNRRGGIRRILISHRHPDHTGGAAALQHRLDVPIYAFEQEGEPRADQPLVDGERYRLGGDTLRVLHTPGHRYDHVCFYLEGSQTLFAGDLIAGEGTVVIIPGEGDMQEYLDSLKRLQEMEISKIIPAHGPIIKDPQPKLSEYIEHRFQREQQILQALEELPRGSSIKDLVALIYTDVDAPLHPLAAQSVEAHLLKLEKENLVERLDPDGWAMVRPDA